MHWQVVDMKCLKVEGCHVSLVVAVKESSFYDLCALCDVHRGRFRFALIIGK